MKALVFRHSLAHVSQLFAIPDGISDEAAVLADPVSVSLRSILLTTGGTLVVSGVGRGVLAVKNSRRTGAVKVLLEPTEAVT